MAIDEQLVDGFGRNIDCLRVSVTDFCNLRCRYCMPEEGVTPLSHDELLSYEEITDVIRHAAAFGIRKVRITGGEPLIRRDIAELVRFLAGVPGIEMLAMSTNATLLPEHAEKLREAGLDRINISLDSFRPETFNWITRSEAGHLAISGIEAARRAGLDPVKLNVVVMRGVNDDEIPDFVKFAQERNIETRFIEYMPHRDTLDDPKLFMGETEILDRIRKCVELAYIEDADGDGPARIFNIKGSHARIGIISSVSRPACATCNRLRLRADGTLVACLYEGGTRDIKTLLRDGATRREIREVFDKVLDMKPREHSPARSTIMNRLGG